MSYCYRIARRLQFTKEQLMWCIEGSVFEWITGIDGNGRENGYRERLVLRRGIMMMNLVLDVVISLTTASYQRSIGDSATSAK